MSSYSFAGVTPEDNISLFCAAHDFIRSSNRFKLRVQLIKEKGPEPITGSSQVSYNSIRIVLIPHHILHRLRSIFIILIYLFYVVCRSYNIVYFYCRGRDNVERICGPTKLPKIAITCVQPNLPQASLIAVFN